MNDRMKMLHTLGKRLTLFLVVLSATYAWSAHAERVKDLASVQGVRSNQLIGYGLVVGLDGSGDQTTQTPFTVQSLTSMLSRLGVNLPAGTSLQLKNVAAVTVTATLPPFAMPGEAIDVTVSSIGNAKSLRGGTLLMAPLRGADGQVYAVAQGNVLVVGAGAAAGGSSAQINHLNAGRIPAGATVEKQVPTPLGHGGFVDLELNTADFTTANRLKQAVDLAMGDGVADALNSRVVRVKLPHDSSRRVAFLARIENLPINPGDAPARVIVNSRTGSVVMNQAVTVDSCAVAHGNLSVTISSQPVVSQPTSLSAGRTVAAQSAQVEVKAEKGNLMLMPASASLGDVVKALNAVGATPQDMMAILQAMKAAGALQAELRVI